MYRLFYYPRNASWVPHMVLEEMGEKFELILVDRKTEEQKSADYLKLNPTGRIPTLVDGEKVIVESAAICLHLCDKNPGAGLVPAVESSNRTEFFQWLFYLTTTVQPAFMLYFYPEKHTEDVASAGALSKAQEVRLTEMFALIDKALEGKDFLVGDELSICDFYVFMLSFWASRFNTKPLSFSNLGRYLKALAQRPSIKKVCETENTPLTAFR